MKIFKIVRIYKIYNYRGSTLFLTSALEGGEGSASRLGRTLPPGKTRYSLYKRLGGTQVRSGQVRKISPPPGFDHRTVQPVGSRYTDYSIHAAYDIMCKNNVKFGRPKMTMLRMRVACWIPNVTNTHSVCVMFIVFPLQ